MKIKILKSKAVGVHNGEKCRYYDHDNVPNANERIRFFYLYPFLPLNIVLFGQVRRTIFKPYYKVKGYFFGKFNDRNLRKDMKRVKAWIDEVVLKKPIYYEYFSRDCDCYEVGGYSYAKNRKAYNENEQAFYEGAEGECWMKQCSKEEYEANKDVRHERDRVMEAFENGSNFYV